MIIPRSDFEASITLMDAPIDGKLSERVFNVEEVCSSDWEPQKPRKVAAPRTVSASELFYLLSRKCRHAALSVCVSAAGDALAPMKISHAPVRDGPADIHEQLFYECHSKLFITYVATLSCAESFLWISHSGGGP
jgi:hypothetical protein